jgi:Zn-dependent protease/CBS domain-containing protein
MRKGFRIARIFGIRIEVDWSWLLIFLLVTLNLAMMFANLHPGWEVWVRWGIALLAALLFFMSVLAHELAHSLVAIKRGMPVRFIRLFLFGGVSNIEREPPTPIAEFLMAFVGPLLSIVFGVLLLAVGSFTVPVGELATDPQAVLAPLSPFNTLVIWLGIINITLGLFNLIPGFPLDGGRMLRSIFWAISKDFIGATRWASFIGRGIAWLMILVGIAMIFGAYFPFLGGGLGSGVWLIFIGWFLNTSASMSYRRVLIRDTLEGVLVERIMRSDPPTVHPTVTIDDLVHNKIMETDDYAFPVIDEENLIGLVTLDDVRSTPRASWEETTVDQIMTPVSQLVSVEPDDDVVDALNKLQTRDVRQLPVLHNGMLVGLVRRRDIVKWLMLDSEMDMG